MIYLGIYFLLYRPKPVIVICKVQNQYKFNPKLHLTHLKQFYHLGLPERQSPNN